MQGGTKEKLNSLTLSGEILLHGGRVTSISTHHVEKSAGDQMCPYACGGSKSACGEIRKKVSQSQGF